MKRLAVAVALLAGVALAQEPQHPRELRFPPLDFTPPAPASFRTKLANGLTAYLVPDATLPSVRLRAYVRTGSVYDPEEKEGLASLAMATLRSGGAGDLDPVEVEDKLDALGASIDADCSDARTTVEAWTLSVHLEAVLEIFANTLRRPGFDEDRFQRNRDDMAAEAKSDEDDSAILATRRMRESLYGDHPFARFRSADTLGSVTRDDVRAFHKKFFTPARVVLAVSGRFELDAMKKSLEKHFGTWKAAGAGWEPVEEVASRARSGIRILNRREMTAAHVELGHVGVKAGAKEEPALLLMDHIWGSGSFTSRVVAKIRTEEALSYACGSDFDAPAVVPGVVRTYFQTQAGEASYAVSLAFAEAKRLATDGPARGELERAKDAVLGRAPSRFATPSDRARAFAEADIDGLPDDHHAKLKDRIAAVTAEDVKAMAARFLGPEGLWVIVIGPEPLVRKNEKRGTSLDAFGTVKVE